MFRTHTCGELRISDANKQVTLSGWVQRSRKMGGMTFIDLRDRYGITQLVFNEEINAELCERANKLGREFVIQITGGSQQLVMASAASSDPLRPRGPTLGENGAGGERCAA